MSAAAATPAGVTVPGKKGKKKLIVIVLVALLVLLGAAAGGLIYMKKKAAAEAEANEDGETVMAQAATKGKADLKHPPTFLPLEPFVVNLADKDSDRYAQVGITLEVEDAKFAEQMKAYMPALRNGVLMLLAHKTARELMGRPGKEQLAAEIQREAARTLGLEVEEPDAKLEATKPDATKSGVTAGSDDAKPISKSKGKKKAPPPNPIHHVHFSTFIIQ